MAIMLFFFQASKKIPFDDPNVLMGVRGLYALSNIVVFGVYFYIMKQIDAKNGMFGAYSAAPARSSLHMAKSLTVTQTKPP